MDRKTMIEDLERIADRMMQGKTTLADPDALLRMAHDLRKPEEREAHEAHVEIDLAASTRALRAIPSAKRSEASTANGAKGGRPRKTK